MEPQPQSTIHGDQVQGDHIDVKIGDNARFVTAGKNINVTYQLPRPLRTPLELPDRADHFQDRKEELAQLLIDLQPGKVVTLCGPGGMGKSALAAEAIGVLADQKALLDRFPDGLISHKFYTDRQVAVLLENIARIFDEELKPSPKEAAKRALSGRRLLLLLDGTEEADDLRAILEIRGECGVLITSRSRKDARAIRQDLLPLPPDDAVTLLQAWSGTQAADHETAYEISQLVGRLPLALRLVGHYLSYSGETATHYLAWLAETPLTALNQGKRQEESIPLLLEHSLAQVSERARQVLGVVGLLALAPFEQIVIAEALTLSAQETRQALVELVNYGLLTRQTEQYEVSHALIHTYTSKRLAQPDETVVHLGEHYKQLITTNHDDFAYLHSLRSHVMTLLPIASHRKLWSVVRSLAFSIDDYLDLKGYWVERITAINLNLAAAQAKQNRQDEGDLLNNLGTAYRHKGLIEQAVRYFKQALVISKEIKDRQGEGINVGNLGNVYADLGDVNEALNYYQQAREIAIEISDRNHEGIWLGNIGIMYADLGQYERAINFYQQAISIAKEVGNRRNESNNLGNMGLLYLYSGQIEKSIICTQQALIISKELGNRAGEGTWLGNLGLAYSEMRQVKQAIDCYLQALDIAKEIGDRRGEGNHLGNLGNAYRAINEIQQAIDYHQQALTISKEIKDRRGEGADLGNLAIAYAHLGQIKMAITYSEQAITIAKEIGDRRLEAENLNNLGESYQKLNQLEQAIYCYEQGLLITRESGFLPIEGEILKGMGNVHNELGQFDHARQYYQQALQIFAEIKLPEADEVRQRLELLGK